jgi:hypothetical protein
MVVSARHIDLRAKPDERSHHFRIVALSSKVKGSQAILVGQVGVCPEFDEKLDDLRPVGIHGDDNGSIPVTVNAPRRAPMLDESSERVEVARLDGLFEDARMRRGKLLMAFSRASVNPH